MENPKKRNKPKKRIITHFKVKLDGSEDAIPQWTLPKPNFTNCTQ